MNRLPPEALEHILSYLQCWQTVQFVRVAKIFYLLLRKRSHFQRMKQEHDRRYIFSPSNCPMQHACADDYYDKVIEYGRRFGEAGVTMIAARNYMRGFVVLVQEIRITSFWWHSMFLKACKEGNLLVVDAAVNIGRCNPMSGYQRALNAGHTHVAEYLLAVSRM